MGINKVILVGNVGRDPEVKSLQSGTTLAKFSLATTEPRFKDQDGKPHTEWHNIVAWGRTAELCQQYVHKGRQLYIEGHIRTRNYEKNGQKVYYTEVHVDHLEFIGSRQGANDSGYADSSYGGGAQGHEGGSHEAGGGDEPRGGGGPVSFPEDADEDVPF